jgi:outer membrane murein-binding lipoprotein Lpp
MKKSLILGAAVLSTSVCGCASQQQLVERMQPTAV